ncbi:hypothetical protein Poli38472_014791 [Pythium oligandrum]|uniref:UDENN domain-containing protein n=1 Tax=Pythium oligandrum TaxID=41045 RepID=A0A8K1CJI9_PYTOL|nr:hypothetical protein Poli38472_014791 [Pythium oligandrum]|eukprot:TMW63881.1 hypothetical protein Poli38472_014791 [Pythium oligandrum]
MSDSDDDAGVTHPRQKSIFSTMGRVRNMNQFREKWSGRASKLPSASSDYASDTTLTASSVSTVSAASSTKKRAHGADAVVTRPPVEPPRQPMNTLEAQRYNALHAWIQQSGIPLQRSEGRSGSGNVFDDMYTSLDDLEAAVQQELASLPTDPRATRASEPVIKRQDAIVSYAVVIGPELTDLAIRQSDVLEASVAFAYPPESQFTAESIDQFCFPRGIVVGYASSSRLDTEHHEFFVLVLSGGGDQGQNVQYGCCLRTVVKVRCLNGQAVDLVVPVCYCVVAVAPYIPFLRAILIHIADVHQQELDAFKQQDVVSNIVPDSLSNLIDSIMTSIAQMSPPKIGGEAILTVESAEFRLRRPRIDAGATESGTSLLMWALPVLLDHISITKLIQALGLLLVEMKVIVVSKSIPLLSATTLSLSALLHPLVWAGPLIIILPPSIHEYLEAPVPIICGVDALPRYFEHTKGTAVINIDTNTVILHSEDQAQHGALQVPGGEELTLELTEIAERISLWRKSSLSIAHTALVNAVSRRIRSHLERLLQVCSRINPCNVYACMKQEQLSLSETLFLKSFMQSQIYQKYTDDLPLAGKTLSTTEKPRSDPLLSPPKPPVLISTGLKDAIHQLFLIALTGDSQIRPREQSSSATSPSSVVPISNQDIEGSSRDDPLPLEDSRSNELTDGETKEPIQPKVDLTSQKQLIPLPVEIITPSSPIAGSVVAVRPKTPWLSPFTFITEVSSSNNAEVVETERQSYTIEEIAKAPFLDLPIPSPTKRHSASYASSEYDDLMDSSRYDLSESRRADTETTISLWPTTEVDDQGGDDLRRTQASGAQSPLSPVNNEFYARYSNEETSPVRANHRLMLRYAIQDAACVKIQTAWRRWRIDQANARNPLSNRPAQPTESEKAKTKLSKRSTTLLLIQESGQKEVLMHVSEDGMTLYWEMAGRSMGSISVLDITCINASDGTVVIQTMRQEHAFLIQPNRSIDVMTFFRELHQDVLGMTKTPSTRDDTVSEPKSTRKDSSCRESVNQHRQDSLRRANDVQTPELKHESNELTFPQQLERGILVLKHGRLGRPHPKYLICDEARRILFWCEPNVTNAGYLMPDRDSAKHSRQNTSEKSIQLNQVSEMRHGKQTRVLHRSTAGRSDAGRCFSIVTPKRTLDIEAFSQDQCSSLFEGIQQLVMDAREEVSA